MTEQAQARIVLVATVLVVLAILLLLVLPDLAAVDPGRYPGPTTPKHYPEP